MIEARIFYKQDQIRAFEISGHAESGPYGYDLVCAGVSAVSFGTVNAILSLCELDLSIEQADDGGYLLVTLPKDMSKEESIKTQTLLQGMIISLQTIEREYSEFITISKQ